MRFYFNEDNRQPTCCLCGNTRFSQLFFCEDCEEWLCEVPTKWTIACKDNWLYRGMAAAEKGKRHLASKFF